MPPYAACSITAKDRLAETRVLAGSFRARHPEVPFHVLLADEVGGWFDPLREPFELVPFTVLDLPHPERLRFACTASELTYAATPFFLRHLLDRGARSVLFLKQESLVLDDLRPLFARLEARAILLTPHLLSPLAGPDAVPRELDVLLAGAYNVGLLGVAEGGEARRFLAWWGERVAADCRHAVAEGLHYEQRWLDLAPGFFEGVEIVRDPGANVGHWCLPERRIAPSGAGWTADGRPLRVARFSGYDVERPAAATRYNDRLSLMPGEPATALFERYRAAVEAAGWPTTRRWPYAWSTFADGTPIPDVARAIYRALGEEVARFGDPFAGVGEGSFRAYLDEPVDGERPPSGKITRLWDAVYRLRPDVRRAFPDARGEQRAAFLAWTESSGLAEHGIPASFLGRRSRT